MKRRYIFTAFILVTVSIAGPSQPFGPNPKLGQTYGGFAEGYLHDAIDILVGCNDSIFSINEGSGSKNPSGNNRAGGNDREVRVGDLIYGHIDEFTIPDSIRKILDNGGNITSGTFIGLPSCDQRNAKPGWNPHIHFLAGNDSVAFGNPWEILENNGLTCGYIQEIITSIYYGPFFEAYANNGSHSYNAELNAEVIKGSLKLIASAGFESHLGYEVPITPRMISWGIDGDTLGIFSFSGQLPRYNPKGLGGNATRASEVMYKDNAYIINYSGVSGSLGNGIANDLNSISKGHWNTLQSSDSSTSWFIPVDPCSTVLRKFKDGPHKVFVNFTSYCDSIQSDTIDVIIDNNPPQVVAQTPARGSAIDIDRKITLNFSEPMNNSNLFDNIEMFGICAGLGKKITLDSTNCELDETLLTITIPESLTLNDNYYITLNDSLMDIAGNSLDGDSNCTEGGKFETRAGAGNCNYAFVAQTGGSTEWTTVSDYESCVASHGYFYCGNFGDGFGQNGWTLKLRYKSTHANITASGVGVVWPPDSDYTVSFYSWSSGNYSFSYQKTGNRFTWEVTGDSYYVLRRTNYVKVQLSSGYSTVTPLIALIRFELKIDRTDRTCNSTITVIDTNSNSYSRSQQDLIYTYENYATWTNSTPAGTNTNYGLVDTINPVISTLGLARKWTGFGPNSITLKKTSGQYFFDGWDRHCAGYAPDGWYDFSEDYFEFTDIPVLRSHLSFNIGYPYHNVAVALGMPTSFVFTDAGSSRPGNPQEEEDMKDEIDKPEQYSLGTPRPNPFNTAVSFDIELPMTAVVDVRIYDILGRMVGHPIDRCELPAGRFTETWKCESCPTGTYFIALQANDYRETRKVTMVK